VATNFELTRPAPAAGLAPQLSILAEAVNFVRKKPLGAAGGLIIIAMLVAAVFAEALAPYDPYHGDYGAQFARPNAEHWFGTDEFGRD
jgi:peptide/nickel transport system permease protein